jgi:hypothetical protein
MSKSKQFFISSKEDLKVRFNAAYQAAHDALAGGNVVLTLSRETRSNVQNAKMWAMLSDLSKQVVYCESKRSPEAWKDILTVAWKEETDLVMSIDNTKLIAVGLSTSSFTKADFADFIEVIYVNGTDFGVEWSDKAVCVIDEFKLNK